MALPGPLPLATLAAVAGLLLGGSEAAAAALLPLAVADALWPSSRAALRGLALGLVLARGAGAPSPSAGGLPAEGLSALVEGRVARVEPPPGGGARVLLDVASVGEGPERRPWDARLDVELPVRGGVPLWPGDRVALAARLRPVPGPRNPGAPDPQRWARANEVDAWAHVEDPRAVEVLERSTGPAASIAQGRREASAALERTLAPADAGLARALLLGDRGGLTSLDRERFRAAGQAHLVAVSGQHVALVLAAVLLCVRRLGVGGRAAALVGLVAVALYVPLTGSPPSAVRSGLGASLWLVGRLALRQPSGLPLLAAAALAMLALAPSDLFDPGFTLSFGAVLGIELLAPRLTAALVPDAPVLPGLLPRRPARLRRMLAVALAAWLGSAGVALFLLGQVCFVAAPLSVPAVPLAAAMLAFAALSALLAPLPGLATVPAWLFARSADLLRALLEVPGRLGLDTVSVRPPSAAWLALSLLTLLVAGLGPPRLLRWALLAHAALFVVALEPAPAPRPPAPRLVALDAGRAPAVVLLLPDGRAALLEAGSRADADAGRRVVVPALRALGIARLDLALTVADDEARLAALADVLSEVPASRCLVPRRVRGCARLPTATPLPAESVLLAGRWGVLSIGPAGAPPGPRSPGPGPPPMLTLTTRAGHQLLWPTESGAEAVDAGLPGEDAAAPEVLLLARRPASAPLAARLTGPWRRTRAVDLVRGSDDDALPGAVGVGMRGAVTIDLGPEGAVLTGLLAPDAGARATPYHRRAVPPPLPPELLGWFAGGLALFALLTVRPLRWLRAGGAVAAWLLGLLATWVLGWPGFAALFAPFVVATLLGKLPGAARDRGRTLKQVAANGLPAALGLALETVPGLQGWGFSFFLGALACLGADTCATEIGVRYGGVPRSVLSGRALTAGESGGVTSAGLVASALGALLAPGAYLLVAGPPDAPPWVAVTIVALFGVAGFAAAVVDSVLGATLQYRGRDPASGAVVEARRIAGAPTERVSGWSWLDNDAVNLATGLVGGAFAAALAALWL